MEQLILRLLPIFSNFSFLLPATRAYKYGLGTRAFLYAFVALFGSTLYHICKGFPRACIWSLEMHHVMDFWSAELVIPISALRFIKFRAPFIEKWIIWTLVVVLGITVSNSLSSFVGQALIAGSSLVFVAIYVVWHRVSHGYWPEYNLVNLTLGVALTVFSIVFFSTQDSWPGGYGYMHALWHFFGAIGQFFLIGIRPPEDPMLNLESEIADQEEVVVPSHNNNNNKTTATGGYTLVEGFAFAPIQSILLEIKKL